MNEDKVKNMILLFDDIKEHRIYMKKLLEDKASITVDDHECFRKFDFSRIRRPQVVISDIINRDKQLPTYCEVVEILAKEYTEGEDFSPKAKFIFENVIFKRYSQFKKLQNEEVDFNYENLLRQIHSSEAIPAAVDTIRRVAKLYVEHLDAPVVMVTILEWDSLVKVFKKSELRNDDFVRKMMLGINNIDKMIHALRNDNSRYHSYGDLTLIPKVNFSEKYRLSFKIEDIIKARNEVSEDCEFENYFVNVIKDKSISASDKN